MNYCNGTTKYKMEGNDKMEKKIYFVLGTVFIALSGIIYTFERFLSYYSLYSQRMSFAQVGQGDIHLYLPNITTNIFIVVFIILGVLFYIGGFKKK